MLRKNITEKSLRFIVFFGYVKSTSPEAFPGRETGAPGAPGPDIANREKRSRDVGGGWPLANPAARRRAHRNGAFGVQLFSRGTHSSGLPKPPVPQRIAKTGGVPDFASQGTKFESDPGNGRFRGCFPTDLGSDSPLKKLFFIKKLFEKNFFKKFTNFNLTQFVV